MRELLSSDITYALMLLVGMDRGVRERATDFFPPPGFSYPLKCLFKDSACYHPEIMGQRGYF